MKKHTKKLFPYLIILLFLSLNTNAQQAVVPSFEAVLSLQSVRNATISPDGKQVVYEVTSTDWEDNRYDTELWLSRDGATPFPLTNNAKGNSNNAKWSPDSQWIAYLTKKEDHTQIYAMRLAGGESFPVTNCMGDVQDFEWSPDGKKLLFLLAEDKEKEKKARSSRFGEYAEEDAEFLLSRLWITAFEPEDWETQTWPGKIQDSVKLKQKTRILLDSVPYTISRFLWSPDGTRVAIQHQPDPMINSFFHSDIALLDPASGIVTPLIHNPSFDGLIDWSPDGQSILYQTALDDSTSNYYRNGELYITDLTGKKQTRVAANFDEEFSSMNWVENGIYATAYQKTRRMLWRIDPALPDEVQAFITSPDRINDFSITEDGKHLAYIGSSPDQLDEIYVKAAGQPEIQITHNTNQISGWKVADGDVIQWASKDGAQIEGVLMKPADYNPAKKYPLLVVIHGGPTGISLPAPLTSYVYPITQWLAKGALVLMPNYRGSAGYGEGFRSLNVRNLGVGDAWDVLSGVDYLIERGMVDPDSMGCMGWSQGGYISAFLTTNTDRFKAISVGAGISDWMTYYVNTDIHPFTRQYLKSTPWSDPGIYALTSPITTINQAKTPTLIQHGEFDRRVPIANGYELYQGLQDVGVPVKMMVYKGFGHGITKPKERLAATWHNWQWFGKYIWGEELSMPEK
ncbi:MAG TPA: S9 family peptidase [Saprospiraceae bacterium]|nr:S9 family peptidase [Saprospiraceae bacterium]